MLEKLLGEEDGIPIELGELFSQTVNHLTGMKICVLLEQLKESASGSCQFRLCKPSADLTQLESNPQNSQGSATS
jgi:hypothetical protein